MLEKNTSSISTKKDIYLNEAVKQRGGRKKRWQKRKTLSKWGKKVRTEWSWSKGGSNVHDASGSMLENQLDRRKTAKRRPQGGKG